MVVVLVGLVVGVVVVVVVVLAVVGVLQVVYEPAGLTDVILSSNSSGATASPEPVQQRHNLKICQNLHIPLK